jgi:hypothetical protein
VGCQEEVARQLLQDAECPGVVVGDAGIARVDDEAGLGRTDVLQMKTVSSFRPSSGWFQDRDVSSTWVKARAGRRKRAVARVICFKRLSGQIRPARRNRFR